MRYQNAQFSFFFFFTFRPLAEMQRLKLKVVSKAARQELKSDFGRKMTPKMPVTYSTVRV